VSGSEHRGFPWRTTAIVAGIVVVASVVSGVLFARDRVETVEPKDASIFTPAPDLVPLEKQRQVTVLMRVRDDEGVAVSNVLVGVGGGTGSVSLLLLPRDLLLPSVPPVKLVDADDPTGAAEEPLQTLLGVQIDATMDLDRLGWAGLIDATGSRVARVPAEMPESFPLVVERALVGLDSDEQLIGQVLTGLGSMARLTVPNEDASHLLSVIGDDLRTLDINREGLPVTYLRSGQARVAVTSEPAAQEAVARLFPEALLAPGHAGQRRVVLQHTGATLGAATAARLDLVAAGFGVVEDRLTSGTSNTSVVWVPDDSPEALSAGTDAAQAIGLPETSVRVDPGPVPTVDVRIALGSDATAV
jgi:hypothetical protein